MRNHVEACVFDAYGTLLDLTGAVARVDARLGDAGPRLLALWRAKQLEYTWLRTVMDRYADFDTVTREALAYALEALGLREPGLDAELLEAFRTLSPHPEAIPLLEALRALGLRTAVLSNGTRATLDSLFARAGLAPLLDAVISVEPCRRYKPAPEAYALARTALALPAERIMFVSMHGWDVAGAASAGYRTVLIDRTGLPAERLPAGAEWVVKALPDVAGLVDA
jgi:2-haloacid dehalogenase